MKFLQWPHESTPTAVTFISDLHLFSGRSNFELHRVAIEESIQSSEMCVWGGDLFDFRWTRLANDSETVTESIRWLEGWLRRYPSKPFVFLSGNHDAHATFVSAVEKLADVEQNFHCQLDAIRVADTLMLHGDLMEGAGTRSSLAAYRETWQQKPVAGRIRNHFYDAIVAARLHTAAASAAHRHRATCRRLWRSVSSELGGEIGGVRRVVFGHTHRQIRGLRCGDVEFFNTGATIRHVKFAPVRLEFPTDGALST